MAEVDLHLHTTFSDGNLSPTEMIRLCAQKGLQVISITDHDSTEGLPESIEAVRDFPDLKLIQGIELSTDMPGTEIHLLGYFVDRTDVKFEKQLRWMRSGREERAREMVIKLNDLGIHIDWSRVQELSAGASIGRPHIAEALVEGGYVEYPAQAFDLYLGRDKAAYIGRPTLNPSAAIELLVSNGAVPVLAHPTYVVQSDSGNTLSALRKIVGELKAVGLAGMEVYYKDYTIKQVNCLKEIADDMDLIPCGGTDYHASSNPGEPQPGATGPPLETVAALEACR